MMNTHPGEPRHWKREPLVWMLIGIPFSAVVMGIVMLTLAIQSWSGLVVDDYYRKGKQINRVLARDRFAYELGLAAGFELRDGQHIEIRFDQSVSVIPGDRIDLKLVHATRPGLDRALYFENRGLRLLEGKLPIPGPGRWNLFLQTGNWRLTGSLQHPQMTRAALRPNYRPQ